MHQTQHQHWDIVPSIHQHGDIVPIAFAPLSKWHLPVASHQVQSGHVFAGPILSRISTWGIVYASNTATGFNSQKMAQKCISPFFLLICTMREAQELEYSLIAPSFKILSRSLSIVSCVARGTRYGCCLHDWWSVSHNQVMLQDISAPHFVTRQLWEFMK